MLLNRRRRKLTPTSPALLRERARGHMRGRDWDRALACLNSVLTEPPDQPVGHDFVPAPAPLVMRGRVRLMLCQNGLALDDALTALHVCSLPPQPPTAADLSSDGQASAVLALALRADTLYQMGKFEHALLFYHRGSRLNQGHHDFRLGIQRATEAILNAFKNVKPLIRIDIIVEDTTRYVDQQRISHVSYVFPRELLEPGKPAAAVAVVASVAKKSKPVASFCLPSPQPFKHDVIEMREIMRRLCREPRPTKAASATSKAASASQRLASEAFSYVRERNALWIKQDARRANLRKPGDCEFNPDYLPYLE